MMGLLVKVWLVIYQYLCGAVNSIEEGKDG